MAAHVDVLVVGAGLSGICAAHALQRRCPDLTFRVLESRASLGGTWDLFRYPGVRSDSDMYTLGYSFRPWTGTRGMGDGRDILAYLKDTAHHTGIARHIEYGVRVESVAWSTEDARWTVRARRVADGAPVELTCRFLWACTGYYRYDAGYTPELPGLGDFEGPVVHPQHWPEDLAVRERRVVVVGSGATAISLTPALAKQGARVTMLQRTPSYVFDWSAIDQRLQMLRRTLPTRMVAPILRTGGILLTHALYRFCRSRPEQAREWLLGGVREAIPEHVDPHFTPPYPPWDQRLCAIKDGDLYERIRDGSLQVVTDHIRGITPRGIALASGERLEADILVTATGLRLQFLGGIDVTVDGVSVDPASRRTYRGSMLQGIPNTAFVVGYVNSSWTLKAELACDYVTRLLRHMQRHRLRYVVPPDPPEGDEAPMLDLAAGYVRRDPSALPRQGLHDPWRMHQDYFRDRRMFRGRIDDGVLERVRR